MKFLLALYELGPKATQRRIAARMKGEELARKFRKELAKIKEPVYVYKLK